MIAKKGVFLLLCFTLVGTASYHIADEQGPTISVIDIGTGTSFIRDYDEIIHVYAIDEDGVDQVWCYYGINGTDEWTNVSMTKSIGDRYACSISGYLNSTFSYFWFHFYANDTTAARSTLTDWVEVYLHETTTSTTPTSTTGSSWVYLAPILIISSLSVVVVVSIILWYKKYR